MSEATSEVQAGNWLDALKPYLERGPLAALLLGVSSGFPFAMIGATLTTRLAQDDFSKSSVTAFSLAFLVYNLKPLWAWMVDGVRVPGLHRMGQRVSWMIFAAALVILAVINLGMVSSLAVGQSPVGERQFHLGPPRLELEGDLAAAGAPAHHQQTRGLEADDLAGHAALFRHAFGALLVAA